MTKQEKIREGLAIKLCDFDLFMTGKGWEDVPEKSHPSRKDRNFYRKNVDSFFAYLKSQGVVIKVESKFPEWLKFKWAHNPCMIKQTDIDAAFEFDLIEDAGYTLTEELI